MMVYATLLFCGRFNSEQIDAMYIMFATATEIVFIIDVYNYY